VGDELADGRDGASARRSVVQECIRTHMQLRVTASAVGQTPDLALGSAAASVRRLQLAHDTHQSATSTAKRYSLSPLRGGRSTWTSSTSFIE
jgi:hypothetical protein